MHSFRAGRSKSSSVFASSLNGQSSFVEIAGALRFAGSLDLT
jgi:hypothetical protein